MHVFTVIIRMCFLNCFAISYTEFVDILAKARYLCPQTSFCDEPPVSVLALPEGQISCCSDCSCKQSCTETNNCCFPPENDENITNEIKSRCFFPEVIKGDFPWLKKEQYKMVVDVKDCSNVVAPVLNVACNRDNNERSACEQNGTQTTTCASCHCSMGLEPDQGVRIGKSGYCQCDKPINKVSRCNCGDAKIAPWGSLLPVYSRTTKLVYKNSVCASCDGVKDGQTWSPGITCVGSKFGDIENVLDKIDKGDNDDCVIFFESPEDVEKYLLPKCVDTYEFCGSSNFQIPYGLNMTAEQVIAGCKSNFSSPYQGRYGRQKNVFCEICANNSLKNDDVCYNVENNKVLGGQISFVLTINFLQEVINKPVITNHPMACSYSRPLDCRAILCPIGQVRNSAGVCIYPMAATYIVGYTITVRLNPMENMPLPDFSAFVDGGKILLENFVSPWPLNWITSLILYESSRLMSSGILANTSAFIVTMGLPSPAPNQTKILERVKRFLEKNWFLNVNGTRVKLKSKILEHTSFEMSRRSLSPGRIKSLPLPIPDWKLVHYRPWKVSSHVPSMVIITKLMFCEQIMLEPEIDSYTLLVRNTVLYFMSEHRYLFEGNFAYDKNGNQNVRICLDDTVFVKQRKSFSLRHMASTMVVFYCFIVHTYVFFFA